MFKKFLVLFLILCSVSAQAKQKKPKPLSTKHVAIGFNANYYYQLSYPNRVKYLRTISGLVSTLGKEVDSHKRGKTASLLDMLLMAPADAAGQCFSGGISYAPPCGTLPESRAKVDGLFSCANDASMQRCSIAFGVGADGGGFCYKKADEGKATSKCSGQSSADAIERLAQKLNACGPILNVNADCKKLADTLKGDTGNLEEYCTGKTKGACATTRTKIADLNSKLTNPINGKIDEDNSCAEADNTIYAQGKGDKANSKWMKMVQMSVHACGGVENTSMDAQLAKFSKCTLAPTDENVESAIANDAFLQQAVSVVQNPSFYGSTNDGDKEVTRAFQDYFGMAPREFSNLFCNTKNSEDFYEKTAALRSGNTSALLVTTNDVMMKVLDDPDLRSKLADVQNAGFREKLKSYVDKRDIVEGLKALYDGKVAQCAADKALPADRAGEVTGACSEVNAAKDKWLQAKVDTGLSNMRGEISKYTEGVDSGGRKTSNLNAFLGSKLYGQYEKDISDIRGRIGDTMSVKAMKARNDLKACVNNAFTVEKSGTGLNNKLINNYTAGLGNSVCAPSPVLNLTTRESDGKPVRIRVLPTSDADKSMFVNKCFVSDGKLLKAPNSGISGCKISTKITAPRINSYLCLDNANILEVYEMKCDVKHYRQPGEGTPSEH
jgi:hypothetical protein